MDARPRPRALTGHTRVAAIIGDPVGHSLSPAIHNAAFEAAGLDWVYLAFEVRLGGAGAALDAMRSLGIAGLSVTMPHKADVAALVDELSDTARILDAVNCVVREGDRLVGHNTDGAGFVASLADQGVGFVPGGRRCVVIGAGGAARAVVAALAAEGAQEVVVVNRTRSRAEVAARLAGAAGRVGEPASLAADLASADLVVNATSVGMDGVSLPLDADGLDAVSPAALVADLVYLPAVTPLMAAAELRGLSTTGGLGMLVHQAAGAFELWTGKPAPVGVMLAAAEAEAGPVR